MAIGIGKCVPNLRVANVDASLAFYVDRLGFTMDWDDAGVGFDERMYASISRDDCQICLSAHAGDGSTGASVWAYVKDVRALHADLVERGATPDHEPREEPWGETSFSLRDPDGNKICFTQPAEKS